MSGNNRSGGTEILLGVWQGQSDQRANCDSELADDHADDDAEKGEGQQPHA